MTKCTAETVAKWLLSKQSMTPKKLQKMLYYAYAWTLVNFNENSNQLNNRLFDDKFEAWVHGPVIPSIYHKYAEYGFNDIPQQECDIKFSDDVTDVLDQVVIEYGKYNGNELESITHQETPWIEARGDSKPLDICTTELSDETIFSYYLHQADI